MSKKGIILFSHGSKREKSNEAFRNLVENFQEKKERLEVRHAFLEFREPDLKNTVENMISDGITSVVIVPIFLFPGKHVEEDLKNMVKSLKEEHVQIEFVITEVLATHPKFKNLIAERIEEGLTDLD